MIHAEDVDRMLALDGWAFYHKTAAVKARKMEESFVVETREGEMRGHRGDYLCVGIEGEMWPIKASIFDASYERIDASS